MDSLEYAVEFAHDENLLGGRASVSHLSDFLATLTLKSSEELNEDVHTFHEKLLQLKREADSLDTNCGSPDYNTKKEELIFRVVCAIKGIDHDEWLRDAAASLEAFLEDEFVSDDV
ncbi:uncharacterized protein LOC108034213 [Drosophila biarmipes]|uniref:uncharacterized protein LOC108034213 n=1 Tax=Drosophila biarmipes TaxID=125945 RepID=UPI0007E6A4AA|nr:uncharacterized protein LOC108034213 [Drosophila biarmipes]